MQQECAERSQDATASDETRAIVHGLRQCDRCRAAVRFLKGLGLDVRLHDLRRDGLDEARLEQWVREFGLARLVNRRGTTWRRLAQPDRVALMEGGDISVLLREPSLLRRPIMRVGGRWRLGFDEKLAAEIEAGIGKGAKAP